MDPIPPVLALPLSPATSAVYTDVQVDPASLPVDLPIVPVPAALTDEDMESDPEEDLQMGEDDVDIDEEESSYHRISDSESEEFVAPMDARPTSPAPAARARSPTPPFFIEHLPRMGGARTIRTPRKRVRFPRAPYASASRTRPHTMASPPQFSPSLDRAIHEHILAHEPPTSPPSSSSSSAAASSTPVQGVAAATPVASDADTDHPYGQDPMDIETLAGDLLEVKDTVIRIEETLATIPGPDNFDDLEKRVEYLDRRGDNRVAQSFAFERRSGSASGSSHQAGSGSSRDPLPKGHGPVS